MNTDKNGQTIANTDVNTDKVKSKAKAKEQTSEEQSITGDKLVAQAQAIEAAPLSAIVLPEKMATAWLNRRKLSKVNRALAAALAPVKAS